MDPQVNPFAVLSLIAAPAILTNACSLLAMSTSNRLLAALRSIYLALGSFAFATLISLIGAVLVPLDTGVLVRTLEAIAVVGGIIAVGALIYGSILLVRETRLAVQVLHERAENVRALAAEARER